MLKILTANFKALSFCSISLPDIMDEATYQSFLKAYRQCIVKIIEQGYTHDFEEGDQSEEIKKLWGQIYHLCLEILSSSINLIYSDSKDILIALEDSLHNIKDEKQAENSSISLNYLAQAENAKKLLQGSSDDLKLISRVFDQCSKLKSQSLIQCIKESPLGSSQTIIQSSNLANSCNKFLKNISEQLIVYYCALSESLIAKSQVASSQNLEREERDKLRIKDFENLISTFFEISAHSIIDQLYSMRSSLTTVLDAKAVPKAEGDESDPWDKINEQYERFSVFMNQVFEFNSGFVQVVNLYIQTFGVFKLKTNLLPTVCHASNDILREISLFNTLMKRH